LEKVSDQDVDQLVVNLTDMPDEELIRLHDKAEADLKSFKRKIAILKIINHMRYCGIKHTLFEIYEKILKIIK